MRHVTLVLAFAAVMLAHGQPPCDGLNASFTWSSTAATGNPVQFSNGTTGTGQQTTWQWSFGDGTTSNEAQPLHEFPGPGTYTVCLVAVSIYLNNAGAAITCVDDYCATVTVPGVSNCSWLNANFTWGAGANGVEFNYQPPTPGAQYTYQWSFGDGTSASTQNAFHSYAAAGTYEVCLTVIAYTTNGSAPCTATSCQMVTWSGGNGGNVCDGLNASFEWTSTPNGVYFVSNSTGLGQTTTYSWSFGDGTSTSANPVVHVYPEPGTYTVCLTVVSVYMSNAGAAITCVDDYCATVTIPGVNNCSWLNANFTWGAGANGVEFNYQPPTPGAQYTYQWSFGDGTSASTQNAFHSYAAAGTYEVCLTVVAYLSNSNAPCTSTSCQMVTWSGGESGECDPSFALEIESEPSNIGFSLTASTNVPNDGITWTFANGLVLSGPTISVGLGSVLNIELCITAWYQPANSTETCTATICGLLSELGFAVGVAEVQDAGVSAWPNPATNELFVRIVGGAAQASVMIHGADGRLEREQTANANPSRIDLSGLAPGLKSVSVSVGGKTERFKIVKE